MLHFNQNIVSLWCCCWCRGGRFPFSVHTQTETEEGPRGRETRVFSRLLSFSFHSLWCRSSSSLIGAVQSADSPFMADGGRVGSGLLECWHVPIRATVLHYSISGSELLQGLKGERSLKQDTVGFLFCLLLFHWRFPIYLSDQVIEDIKDVDL